MDSIVFFEGIGQKFNNKSGIYVFKSPLKYNGQDMYKIGYAYQSLLKRLKDYKTAYGPIHFNIYCVYEIPDRIVRAPRTMWALGSEKQLHKTLEKNAIMKNEEDGRLEGEWFYNLDDILETVHLLRKKHLDTIQNADKWELYMYGRGNKIITRSRANNIKLVDITDNNSQFNKIQPRERTTRNVPSKKYGDEYETEHNNSRNFLKDKNIYIGK